MPNVPKDPQLDSTLSILSDGYTFIERRSREYHSDIFETRILGEKAACLHGQEGARFFYDTERFKREGATPKRIQKTLFGEHGVQSLDGEAHRHRKEAFMSLMNRETVSNFMSLLAEQWKIHLLKWEQMDEVLLFEESRNILCRAACKWAGVPLREDEVVKRAKELIEMVDAFGGVGMRNLQGRIARSKTEKWIGSLVEQVRAGDIPVKKGTALEVFSFHRDLEGKQLDTRIASVEVLNIIRPLVAITWFNNFLALALYQYPQYREKLQNGGDAELENFVQEVRRFYPFTPFLGARARDDFEWKGYQFSKDQLVLLDIYGTNRDERQWERAEVFWPERFQNRENDKYGFIPQGGGDFGINHRCAGEWVTIGAMKVALEYLVNRMEYEVPEQDLSYDLSRMPAGPKSGMVISKVKAVSRKAESKNLQNKVE
jgi:fatty-acid peroxygenase